MKSTCCKYFAQIQIPVFIFLFFKLIQILGAIYDTVSVPYLTVLGFPEQSS